MAKPSFRFVGPLPILRKRSGSKGSPPKPRSCNAKNPQGPQFCYGELGHGGKHGAPVYQRQGKHEERFVRVASTWWD